MKKVEILSPAGSKDSLIAAIEAGCDAVYLSGNLYGARSYATNFNDEELRDAVIYVHGYGVRVYVTVNILIYESEIKNFLKYIEYLHSINVDAIIVQDIGMMDLIHQKYPSLEIHASTQMHIHNLSGVKLLEQLGINRVVLARETPIELIKEIKENTDLDLEIFVHGALCISYSGQCLMSSLIGGRSGNRGTCAQCCRQPYKLLSNNKVVNKDEYLLSTKDLNTLNHLDELLKIGVSSLKIEGRMKRPEYVYLVTKIYRKAVDSFYDTGKVSFSADDLNELKKIFNREFTKGFIFHEKNDKFTNPYRPNHLGIKLGTVLKSDHKTITVKLLSDLHLHDGIRILMKEEDFGLTVLKIYKNGKMVEEALSGDIVDIVINKKVQENSIVLKTSDEVQLKKIQTIINEKRRKVNIDINVILKSNSPIYLSVTDGINKIDVKSEYLIQSSKNMPTTKDTVVKQISKLGNTIFKLKNINIEMENDLFIPIKVLNEIRRDAIEKLFSLRLYQKPIEYGEYSHTLKDYPVLRSKSITVTSKEHYQKIKNQLYDVLYMDLDSYENIDDDRKVLKMSRVIENHQEFNTQLLVGELGSINKYKNVISDFSLNVVNSYSVAFLHSLGVSKVTLSYELNESQIKKIIDNYKQRYQVRPNLEMIVAGKIESMIMKYRLLKHYNIKTGILKDKYGNEFEVEEKNNLTYIYHFKKLKIDDYEKYYDFGINWLRF